MIDERLRAHMEALAAPITLDDITDPTYTTVTVGRVPTVRPMAMGRPVAIAATIIALASVIAFVTDRRAPTLARPGAWIVVEAASAVFAAQSGVPLQSVTVASMVPYREGLVAVGYVSSDAQSMAAAWRSDDGRAWTRLTSDSFLPAATDGLQRASSMSQVVVRGGRLVALGVTTASVPGAGSSSLAAWTSDDGAQWERHDFPMADSKRIGTEGQGLAPAYPSPNAIVATHAGFLAFADDNGEVAGRRNLPLVFGSSDGVAWSPIEAKGLDEQGAYVLGALVYRGHVIAYGSRGGHSGQPTAWTSDDDGATWRTVTLPYENAQPYGAVERAIVTSSGLLLTGGARTGYVAASVSAPDQPLKLEGELDTASWLSRDGVAFEQLDTSPLNTAGLDDITAVTSTRGGALLALDRTEPAGRTTHFFSWSNRAGFVDEGAGEVASVSALTDYRGAFLAATAASNTFMIEGRDLGALLWRSPHR